MDEQIRKTTLSGVVKKNELNAGGGGVQTDGKREQRVELKK